MTMVDQHLWRLLTKYHIQSIQYKNTAHIKVCIFKHVERYERMGNGTLGRELREKRD